MRLRLEMVGARIGLCGVLALCSGACDVPALDDMPRIDSAGVAIVTISGDLGSLPEWSLGPEPLITLGAADDQPGHDFFLIRAVVQLDDGKIVVADDGSAELRFFNRSGELVNRAGGRGEGPGEFQRIQWLRHLGGDSLLAYDPALRRLTMFDNTGGVLETRPVLGNDSVPYPGPVQRWSDGSLLLRQELRSEMTDGVKRPDFRVYLQSSGSSDMRVLGEFPADDSYYLTSGQAITRWPVPFGYRTALLATANRWYVADNAKFDIKVFLPSGEQIQAIRRNAEPEPVAASDVSEFVQELLAGVSPERRDRVAGVMRNVEARAMLPMFGAAGHIGGLASLVADSDENLWVLEYAWHRGKPTRWTVVGSMGEPVAGVTIPPEYEPLQIGRDFAIFRVRDALGVETVREYELIRNNP